MGDRAGAGSRGTTLAQGANPYEIASTIVDEWCDGAMSDLRLVDVISREGDGGWELAVVFRAELTALPRGERGAPRVCDPQDLAGVQGFEAVDLERWLGMSPKAPVDEPAREQEGPTAGVLARHARDHASCETTRALHGCSAKQALIKPRPH